MPALDKVQLFISYSVKDATLAGDIRRAIEKDEKFSCFLAHDDIQPGSDWDQTIRESLFDADCILTIQTENFKNSLWCQQEIGMALQLGKAIVPLIPQDGGIVPQGFHAKYHAFSIKNQDIDESIKELLRSDILVTQLDGLKQRTDKMVEFEKVLVEGSALQIKARIDLETSKYLRQIDDHYALLKDVKTWQEYWQAHLDMIYAARDIFVLAGQIIRFKHEFAWQEFLRLLGDLHSINASQDRYGRGGWINQLFYSIFLILGGFALGCDYIEGLKKMVSLKKYREDRLETVLDWNVQATYIEDKNNASKPKYYVPRFNCVLELVENKDFPIQIKNFKELIADFDLVCFMQSVKFNSDGWHWYPCSMYFFDYRTPRFLLSIKQDVEFREAWGKSMLGISGSALLEFIKTQASPVYTDLQRKSHGFPSDSPFKIFSEMSKAK